MLSRRIHFPLAHHFARFNRNSYLLYLFICLKTYAAQFYKQLLRLFRPVARQSDCLVPVKSVALLFLFNLLCILAFVRREVEKGKIPILPSNIIIGNSIDLLHTHLLIVIEGIVVYVVCCDSLKPDDQSLCECAARALLLLVCVFD